MSKKESESAAAEEWRAGNRAKSESAAAEERRTALFTEYCSLENTRTIHLLRRGEKATADNNEQKQRNMHTQENKTEAGKRKGYQAPNVEKIQIDTEFTFFTTSTGSQIPNNPGNSLEFNPLKFFK